MRRPRVVAGAMIALAFAVGGLSGMAVEEALGLDWFDFLDEDEVEDSVLAGFELTGAQRAQAEAALERQEERLEDYWEARLPEMRAIMRESNAEIRAILTPEQQRAFDARVRERENRIPSEGGD